MHFFFLLSFCVWLVSLSKMSSSSSSMWSHIIRFPFIIYMCHIFFIYSFIDGHSDCFYLLVLVNKAAVKLGSTVSQGGTNPRYDVLVGSGWARLKLSSHPCLAPPSALSCLPYCQSPESIPDWITCIQISTLPPAVFGNIHPKPSSELAVSIFLYLPIE